MTDLHAEIMNLKADGDKREEACYGDYDCYDLYNIGHRDARHAAAELSLKQQVKFEEALDLLWATVNPFDKRSAQARHEDIIKFLEENK